MKEKQVEQLRTQVVDLERFVDFLQGKTGSILLPVYIVDNSNIDS